MIKEKLTVMGSHNLIDQEALYTHIYRSLKWTIRIRGNINKEFVRSNTTNVALMYHPIWLAKTLVIADRKPFSPKKTPNMVFVDAISGYRGIVSKVPETADVKVHKNQIVSANINDDNAIVNYIKDVQTKQINRSYVLKKPRHKIIEYFLVYLPLWMGKVSSHELNKEFTINANTGESENYMASLW